MKRFNVYLSAALAALMLFGSATVFAQENGNRDENGKIVRGPYETNGFGANWFIGVAGGINVFVDGGGYIPRVGGALDVNVGKWFTPSIGARVGYSGLTFSEWTPNATILGPELNTDKDMYQRTQGFAYVHADAMWNISNAFSGYKETRFWDFIPYVHGGVFCGYGANGIKYKNNEFAAGLGLYNTMRLCDRVKLSLDIRGIIVRGDIHEAKAGAAGMVQATFGVVVNLGKTNWKRATNVPAGYKPYNVQEIEDLNKKAADLEKANKALEQKYCDLTKSGEQLTKEKAAMAKELNELKSRNVSDATPGAVFFYIGSESLDEQQLFQLDFYVKTCIAQDKNKVFHITGYADTKTGSKARNEYLSKKRVQNVYDILLNKYNIPADRLVVKSAGAENRFDSVVLNRAVVLE